MSVLSLVLVSLVFALGASADDEPCNLYTDDLYLKTTWDDPPYGNCRCDLPVDSDPNDYSRSHQPSGSRYTYTEWSRVKGIIVGYIYKDSIEMEWDGFGVPVDFLQSVAEFDHLYILVSPPDSKVAMNNARQELRDGGVKMSHVHLIPMLLDSWWTRDFGPWFVNRNLPTGGNEVLVVDHTYNRIQKVEWDAGGCRMYDNHVPCAFAKYLGIPCELTNLTLTGGNLMVDEYGTAASTDLVTRDNPDLNLDQIKAEMTKYFGTTRFDAFPDPQTTYIDHVDTWSKVIGAGRVVVGSVPTQSEDYEALENAAAYLTTLYDEVYRLPMAKVNGAGDLVSGFYLNCLFVNDRLYVPTITSGGVTGDSLNAEALARWQEILGTSIRVVGVKAPAYTPDYPMTPSTWHQWFTWDALHCRTITVPDIALYIEGYQWPDDAEENECSSSTLATSLVASLFAVGWFVLQ